MPGLVELRQGPVPRLTAFLAGPPRVIFVLDGHASRGRKRWAMPTLTGFVSFR
jgi:hypothetical protein